MSKRSKQKKNKDRQKGLSRKELAKLILGIMRNEPTSSFNYKQLAKALDIRTQRERTSIVDVLYELAENDQIKEIHRGKFKFSQMASLITGRVDMTRSGAGFVVVGGEHDDIFISQKDMNRALHGDTVSVSVWQRKRKKQPQGEVIEILKNARTRFGGTISISKNYAFLETADVKMPYDIFIPIKDLNGAKDGQKVLAEITSWERKAKNPIGKVTDILGDAGENNAEMHAILAEFNLPYSFPKELDVEAEKIDAGITPEEIAKRKDFRDVTTITIDPKDAKDFDDALSYRKLENGNVEIGVHIADVTHYVQPGTNIEAEAQERATSVYLVDRTVPMLPERLSNGICSLRPNEEKLTYAAVFELDKNAKIKNQWIGRTVINSDRRFTYEEAQSVIETGEGDYAEEILEMDRLAKVLRKERFGSGSISFDRVEVRFNIDEDGKPVSVYFKEAKDANKLIEEFMLLANRKTAALIGDTGKSPKTFVYRIHDEPDIEKLYTFNNFIKRYGYKMELGSTGQITKSLNHLLGNVKGKAEQNAVEQLAIRSMAKAEYSTENIGHYGLGFQFYSHFTSPIRRYPDMMVHRLLTHYLEKGNSVSKEKLDDQCKHSSDMENRAAKAERASIKYKQVEFMSEKLGYIFDAVITGVAEHGIYAEIVENKIEGLISMRDMDDDYYTFYEKNYCITGEKYKKSYTLGDNIKIQIIRADIQRRRLDFILADEEI